MNRLEYFEKVYRDLGELYVVYPFCKVEFPPIESKEDVIITVVAANNSLIDQIDGSESDFLGYYSRKLIVVVPSDYCINGCDVYGGAWIDRNKIPPADHHWFSWNPEYQCLKLCVGVPASFCEMNNVILENVKTAENMLIAYECYQRGLTKNLQLNAYSHGEDGWKQYEAQKRIYHQR